MIEYAFPSVQGAERPSVGSKNTPGAGMTLKDWFAGQAIAAMMGSDAANSSQRDKNGQHCLMEEAKLDNMAKIAYQVAEALMKVRGAAPSERW